jgi:hypothetical protein
VSERVREERREELHHIKLAFSNLFPLSRYVAWLPDKTVTLHRDHMRWCEERLSKFGNSHNNRQFWEFMDKLSSVFWDATRHGIKLSFYYFGCLLFSLID